MDLHTIGVLAHPNRPATAPVAEHIAGTLTARGLTVWRETSWTEAEIASALPHTSLVIAIGGDGAMLRAARAAALHNVPVLGVNMGYLGFLTEIATPDEWESALEVLISGAGWIERRMMIRAEARSASGEVFAVSDALNDVVISRGNVTRMIRLPTYIDGHWATTYHADALVIATATGSTAYALACGGPILPPELENVLVVPVAPHLSLDRSIILPSDLSIRVQIDADSGVDPVLAVDGARVCELHHDDEVMIQASSHVARFVRLRDRNYFYRSLLDRLEPRVHPPKETP